MSSQKKLALSWLYTPEGPANTTEPAVKVVEVPVPPFEVETGVANGAEENGSNAIRNL